MSCRLCSPAKTTNDSCDAFEGLRFGFRLCTPVAYDVGSQVFDVPDTDVGCALGSDCAVYETKSLCVTFNINIT